MYKLFYSFVLDQKEYFPIPRLWRLLFGLTFWFRPMKLRFVLCFENGLKNYSFSINSKGKYFLTLLKCHVVLCVLYFSPI